MILEYGGLEWRCGVRARVDGGLGPGSSALALACADAGGLLVLLAGLGTSYYMQYSRLEYESQGPGSRAPKAVPASGSDEWQCQ